MRFRFLTLASVAAIVASGAIAAPAPAAKTKTITMSGSTSIAPLATQLARAYARVSRGKVKFVILQGGSDIGINDVARGRVTLGMSSRNPKPADPGGIVFNKVARDSVCLVAHPSNTIPTLSTEQVQGIFSGQVRNWSQVPGSQASGSIRLVVRTAASGTQDAFQQIFLGDTIRVASSAQTKSSNGLQQQALAADPQAIGYASFAFTQGLHTIPFAGVPCTLQNAKSGQYGGVRNFFFVSRGGASGPAKGFINFVRKSRAAKRIIGSDWIPLK